MDAEFTLPEDWRFKRENALPETYRGIVLRGAKVITATGEKGNIIIQTFEQPLFTIRFKQLAFIKNVTVIFQQGAARLISFLSLKNNIHYNIAGIGVLKLKEGQFSLLHSNSSFFTARYEKNKIYQSLEIDWAEEIIKEGIPFFPLLAPPLEFTSSKSFFIGKPSHEARADLLGVASEILKSPYDEAFSGLLFQNKARDYFFFIMVAIGRIPASNLNLTPDEWKKIEAIAILLKTNPDKKYPIVQLAAKAQMNTMKFKQAFKEKYDSGPFEYQMAQRMQEALEILQEGSMNAKEVAAYIGYKGLSSFITKFREYHGYPPGKVIKNP